MRRRSLRVVLATVILGTGALASVGTPTAGAMTAAVVVPASTCARFDPNIGSGACLKYQARSGTAYTWLGTYRASNNVSFFCIDYLYDSRISAGSSRVSTTGLRNQLNRPVGANEIAALNYLISTRAPSGSAGSPNGNAAIALIIREVMGDGIRNDGTIVYPPGLKVHGIVKPLPGGAPSALMSLAQQWWADASQHRGPWSVRLDPQTGSTVPLGQSAGYRVRVLSADGRSVPGAAVTLTCSGPVTCPTKLTTSGNPVSLTVTPRALGSYTVTAKVTGPSAQAQLLKGAWAPHAGTTAINHGVQRGWIAQRVTSSASASGAAQVVKGTPHVVTQAQPTARPGDSLSDLVTVSDLPSGYDHAMTATLYGPFDATPAHTSCTTDKVVGAVTVPLTGNGTLRTPTITPPAAGYYVWTESLPGDDQTLAVDTPCGLQEETTLVRASPRISTAVVARQTPTGAQLHDEVTLTDALASARVTWTLYGPLAPTRGGCSGLDWTKAPAVARGELATTGDGQYLTPETPVTTAGCYTYGETLPASLTSGAVETALGESTETALVVDRPTLHTVASTQNLTVPGNVFDTIRVSGVTAGRIEIGWVLLGPIAPRGETCAGLDWSAAPRHASGRLASGNGLVRTPRVPLTIAGCYTFREHSIATATAAEADTPPGLPEETVMATRPVLGLVPEVPTGPVSVLPGWWRGLADFLAA